MTDIQLCEDELQLLNRLGTLLQQRGYDQRNLLARLPPAADEQGIEAPYVLSRHLDTARPLDAFIALFNYQGGLTRDRAETLLSPSIFAGLVKHNLLKVASDPERVYSQVDIVPQGRDLFITDLARHKAVHLEESIAGRIPLNDRVMYVGNDSQLLIRGTQRERIQRTLDLCCGCGIHALLSSAHSHEVIGVDLNPRAVRYARMNAAINHKSNVRFEHGNLYESLEGMGGEDDNRFDLILANPPFVATPGGTLLFRDGGESGEDVLSRIVSGLPDFLREHGLCQIVTDMVIQKDLPYRFKLKQWLGSDHKNFDILIVTTQMMTPFEYALSHQQRDVPGQTIQDLADGFEKRMESYDRMEVQAFHHGLINIRRVPEGRPGWVRSRQLQSGGADPATMIRRALERTRRYTRENILGPLSNAKATFRPGTHITRGAQITDSHSAGHEEIHAMSADGTWADEDTRLDEDDLRMLMACDGTRLVADILNEFCKSSEHAARLNSADRLIRFYEAGLVDLTGSDS